MDANTEFIESENRMLRTELRAMRTYLAAIARSQPKGEIHVDDRDLAMIDANVSIEVSRDERRMETVIKVK